MLSYDSPQSDDPPIADTWQVVERLLDDLEALVSNEATTEDFHASLVQSTQRVLGAVEVSLWVRREGRFHRLDSPAGRPPSLSAAAQAARTDLLAAACRSGGRQIGTLPGSGAIGSEEGGTGSFLLICEPFGEVGQTWSVIEVVLASPDSRTERGALRWLEAVSQTACDFYRRRELARLREVTESSGRLNRFAERIHGTLSLRDTCYEIVNESRQLLGCDRVSLVRLDRGRPRLEATSGVDSVNRRSDCARRLQDLVQLVGRTGEMLIYRGGIDELPPEIQDRLNDYLEQSPTRNMAIVPLQAARDELPSAHHPPRAILVAEQFQDTWPAEFQERLETLCRHITPAFDNALEYSTLPGITLMQAARHAAAWVRAPGLVRTLGALGVCLAVILALWLIPADFRIEATGQVQPRRVANVFAPLDGEVAEVLVTHDQPVRRGDVLIVLRSSELELEYRRVFGEHAATRERLFAIESARLQSTGASEAPGQPGLLSGNAEELRKLVKSQEEQLEILRDQRSALRVTSPQDGVVLTWEVAKLLESRPVLRGQILLRVAEIGASWELQLAVPENGIGHVLRAQQQSSTGLPVEFVLATQAGEVHRARAKTISRITESSDADELVVNMTAEVEDAENLPLRPGAGVIAKIHCGRRSLGYVWLRDVVDVVRTRLLF
jgi:multidrug efflux pump subunit AcrA (membrane-fusion protein)